VVGRREVVVAGLAGGAALLAGCTGDARPNDAARTHPEKTTPDTTGGPGGPTTGERERPLPESRIWRVRPSETEPEAKRAAIRLLERLAQWPEGSAGRSAAVSRLRDLDIGRRSADRLVDEATPLLGDYSEATVRVVATQYGGLIGTSASVLVAMRQWKRRLDDSVVRGGSTVDVRLEKVGRQWQVTKLRPSRPGPRTRPEPELIRRVVEHRRIHLPPAARADVLAGSLCPLGMKALLDLAREYDIGASVVHSGHPYYVFGTHRLSDHTRKRAFDVWAINGHPIVAPKTSHDLVDGFMRAAVAAGAYNVGGPRQLDGDEFFSDVVHHDHTHIAFDRDR
jgi:hypothetical protein